MKFFYYFLTRHKLVNLTSLLLLALGLLSLSQTNIDLVPPMDFKGVRIDISYPEAGAGDMEEYVVFPIEEKLANFPNLKSISSSSNNGSARISMTFPAGHSDMSTSVATIKETLESLKPYLPRGIRDITVKERKQVSTFQNFIYVKGADLTNSEHEKLLDGVKNNFSAIKGIVKIDDSRPKKELIIDFDEKKLKKMNLTVGAVTNKVRSYFEYVPLGSLRNGNKRTIFEFKHHDAENLEAKVSNLTIKSNAIGYNTKLSDIANVEIKREHNDYQNFHDSKPTYYFRLEKDLNSDVLSLDSKIMKIVDDFNKKETGLTLTPVVSGKGFIQRQLTALKANGILGIALVSFLLFVFLSYRAALCTLWGIPIAYAGTFLVIFLMGMSINLLSVVGLILVAGILVDDALIVTEKYNDSLEQGLLPIDAAKKTINELFVPVLGTALTTLVAFLPLILIPSELGTILFSIPVVVIGALLFSILESFLILPSHLITVNKRRAPGLVDEYYEKVKKKYQAFVQYSVSKRYYTLGLLVIFSCFAIYFSLGVEKNFNLNIGDEVVSLRGKLKKSSTKKETLRQISFLNDKMKELAKKPDFIDVSVGVGSLWVDGEQQIGDGYFQVRAWLDELHPNPVLVKNKLEEQLKGFIKEFESNDSIFEFINVQKGFENGDTANQKYLAINFYTKSSKLSLSLDKELEDLPKRIKNIGAAEVGANKVSTKWSFSPNFRIMEQLGVDKDQVKNALIGKVQDMWINETRVNGKPVTIKTTINGKEVQTNSSGFDPKNVFLVTANESKVSLSSLGKWEQTIVPESIDHLNGFKVQQVKFPILDSKKREEVIKASKPIVAELQEKFPEYIVKSSGESVEEAENKAWILNALIACLVGIYFVLVMVLGSFSQPFVVSLPILFGVIGVLLAHKLHSMSLGVLAGVGLIGAIGVSVNGSLIMADQINIRLRKLKTFNINEVVAIGAASRFRAIVLTSLTTLGGLFPMAYGLGGDSGFTKALAFSMAWGILLSSILTLFFFPSVFAVMHDLSNINFIPRRFKKLTKSRENSYEDFQSEKPETIEKPKPLEDFTDSEAHL